MKKVCYELRAYTDFGVQLVTNCYTGLPYYDSLKVARNCAANFKADFEKNPTYYGFTALYNLVITRVTREDIVRIME